MSCVAPAERLFLPETVELSELSRSSLLLTGETASHLSRVLRVRVGSNLWLGDGQGHIRHGLVSHTSKREVSIEFDGELVYSEPAQPSVVLALAMLQNRDDLEHALIGAVEAGVDAITLFRATRSNKSVPDLSGSSGMRLKKIVREASAQARRAWIPALKVEDSLSTLCSLDADLFVADPGAKAHNIEGLKPGPTSLAVLVGPEGGFDEDELALIKASGAEALWLGPSVLRARTAASIAVHRLTLIRSCSA